MVVPLIKYRSPATSVIIITDFSNDAYFQRAICSGVTGYLVKEADIDSLRRVHTPAACGGVVDYLAVMIRTVYKGGCFLSPKISARLFTVQAIAQGLAI
ncbi:hypothetical protein [Treponema sp. TIM-1]|uniref:hypothetical protein n=1 Tax=Treponema sp. TIM-1 TaxID=2898417 RepID=UPI003980196F